MKIPQRSEGIVMDKKEIQRIPFFGIILVAVGTGLLMRQLHIIRIDGTTMVLFGLAGYGAAMVIRSFVLNIRHALFFGSLCFYSGVLMLLGNYDLIEHSPYVYVPGFLTAFGLAFMNLFVFNTRDYHLLLPALIFIGLGAAFMLTETGFLYPSDVKEAVMNYWPVVLILFGILMLFRRKKV